MKSAADYLAQYNISMDFNKSNVEPKYPYMSFKDKKDIKKLKKIVKEIRPNYKEFDNTKLYKDKHCSMWTHVCEATLENGIKPITYVSQPLPLNDIEYITEVSSNYNEDVSSETDE